MKRCNLEYGSNDIHGQTKPYSLLPARLVPSCESSHAAEEGTVLKCVSVYLRNDLFRGPTEKQLEANLAMLAFCVCGNSLMKSADIIPLRIRPAHKSYGHLEHVVADKST